jgi:subtilisin-like proprotein convertase family protein
MLMRRIIPSGSTAPFHSNEQENFMTRYLLAALTKLSVGLTASLLSLLSGSAATASFAVNQPIPDGSAVGLADTQTISGVEGSISSLTVDLRFDERLNGGWNGDLYVTLVHDDGFSVLLNRPGKRLDDSLGFDDSGLNVTIDDSAKNGDIHNYRLQVTGDLEQPLSGPLTGVWQPDGRLIDPDALLDTDVRTAGLGDFAGLDPNGRWTLFVTDLEYGGALQLTSWGLNISTGVPDPSLSGLGLLSFLLVLFGQRHVTGERKS